MGKRDTRGKKDTESAEKLTAAGRHDYGSFRKTAGGPAPFSHMPVMPKETIDALSIKPDGIYVDCTAGGGGHSELIAKRLSGGRLISIDRDEEAVAACSQRLAPYGGTVSVIRGNFRDVKSILAGEGIDKIDGFLIDLGVSSHQIDTPERGFSYMADGPLDMRMSRDGGKTAFDVVNGYTADELTRIFYEYGEEKFAGRIARRIVAARETSPIKTTGELAGLTVEAVPKSSVPRGSHPAKRVFQAIRIEVNGELDVIEPTLRDACGMLSVGGRAAVLTFHSLEDRIVKRTFSDMFTDCVCPPDFPVCVCGHRATMRQVTKKPVTAGEEEINANPRSRSAKLRAAEKI